MMNKQLFIWLKINTSFFIASFIICLLLSFLFPNTMLDFVRSWGAFSRSVGPIVLDPVSSEALFVNIITKNALMTSLYSVASLLFLAPILAIMAGAFYSLGLMSAIDSGVLPIWHSPFLIAIEVSFILLATSTASWIGSEIFGVEANKNKILDFWKKNWKRPIPEHKTNLKQVFIRNKKKLISFMIIIIALLLLGAWIEVFI